MEAIRWSVRVIGVLALMFVLISDVQPGGPVAAQESRGSLAIALFDEQGNPLGGGCFDANDAIGATQSVCDDDGDGLASLIDLPVGAISVTQTSGPDGFDLATPQSGTIESGVETRLSFYASTVAVETPAATAEPTEEPTQEPTTAPTEVVGTPEPTDVPETATATAEASAPADASPSVTATPGENAPVSLAAESGAFGLKLEMSLDGSTILPPGAAIPLNSTVGITAQFVNPGTPPQGSIKILYYNTVDCSDSPSSNVRPIQPDGSIPSGLWYTGFSGVWSVRASFAGDSNHPATVTSCEDGIVAVGMNPAPTQSIELRTSLSGSVLPPGSSRTYGAGFAIFDRISGLTQAPDGSWGKVSFRIYNGADCSGGQLTSIEFSVSSVNAQLGMGLLPVQGFQGLAVGTYGFRTYYFDTTGTNAPSWSGCDTNIVITKAQPVLSITAVPNVISTSEYAAGKGQLVGGNTLTGSVTYNLYSNGTCSGGLATPIGPFALVNGEVPQSTQRQFTGAGSYGWTVEYSGDANHESVSSGCALLTVKAPQLALDLEANADAVTIGDTLSYTLTLRNTGAGDALQPTLTDQLPDGLTWQIVSMSPEVACETLGSNALLSCSAGRLGASAQLSVKVSATIPSPACGTLTNTASATATNHDTVTSLQDSVAVRCGDLAITKLGVPGASAPGLTLEYRIEATNAGDGPLRGVVVTDDLAAAIPGQTWTVSSSSPSSTCAIASGVLRCDWGTISPGGTNTVYVRATPTTAGCGSWTNTARGTASNEPASRSGNNTATAPIIVNCTDVAITKTPLNAVVTGGDDIGFSLVVSNPSSLTAQNVSITDTLPAGFSWRFNDPACSIASGVLSCNVGSLLPGQSRTVTIMATTSTTFCGTISNTVTTTTTDEDPRKLNNNSATATAKVGCPDLQVTNVANSATVGPGGDVIFTVTVTNIGDGEARGVKLMYSLPYGVDWVGQASGCAIYSGAAGCDFRTLAAGESRTLTLTGRAPAGMCGTLGTFAFAWADNEQSSLILNNMVDRSVLVAC